MPASKTVNLLAIRLTATDPAAFQKGKPGEAPAQGSARLLDLGDDELVAEVELAELQEIRVALAPGTAV